MTTMTAATGKSLTIRQVKSGIGFAQNQKSTLKALGLGKIGRERTHPDNEQIRGMVFRVKHLVEIVADPAK